MIESRTFRRWYAVFVFFTVLAGDAWRYSITWYGFGALVVVIATMSTIFLVKERRRWRASSLPYPLLAFVALAIVSTAWSFYPAWTAIGALTTVLTVAAGTTLAIILNRDDVLWAFSTALKIILGASLAFESVVSVFVRHPILPWWENFGSQKIHPADYWSRDLLFTGERIQGIVGNSNLLGFVALLGLIAFAIQLASRSVRLGWGIFWLVIAALCIGLSRSGTVTVAIVIVAAAAIVLLLARRARTRRGRWIVYGTTLVIVAVGAVCAFVFSKDLLKLLGKSSDITGRTEIWNTVIQFASQRPVAGWGWVSYWVPFIAPFDTPQFRTHTTNGGVQLLQAHEAWLDVWFQLGVIGLIIFAALVISVVARAWLLAVDRPAAPRADARPFTAVSMLPILVLVALLAQSLAESRLLIEYGMLLLSLFAVSTKREVHSAETR